MKNSDLKTVASELEAKMKSRLETFRQEESDMTVRYSKILSMIGEIIHELKEFVVDYEFINRQEEISFFKEIKPVFLAQHRYYSTLLALKNDEPFTPSQKVAYYLTSLDDLQAAAAANSDFHRYCLTGSSILDEKYFVRGNIPMSDIVSDRKFSTVYDEQLGQLIAFRLLKEHITGIIYSLSPGEEIRQSPLNWTGSKADLIELIYGLETIGALNKGKADIKEIASLFESAFNISLGNYYRQFLDIRLRKKEKTTFLNEMKERLEVRINDFR